MAQNHEHDHDGSEHSSELSEMQLRVRALETVLTEKGYVDPPALDAIIEAYETKIGPHIGARVVAKAWSDPSFKRALLENGSKAVLALGAVNPVGDHLIAVENTPKLHNMIVCTLCSCYPWEVLGLPPVWYKAAPYRSRAVNDPRGVLRGLRRQAAGGHQHSRLGLDRRDRALSCCRCGRAGTEGWSEEEVSEPRHARQHDRHRSAETAQRGGVMDGVHDMGGMHGFGKVESEKNEPVFHDDWERRTYALYRAMSYAGSGPSTRRAPPASDCRRTFTSPVPITESGNWAWKSSLSNSALPGPTSLRAGHALRPGKPLKRKLTAGEVPTRSRVARSPGRRKRRRGSSPAIACAPRTFIPARIPACRVTPAGASV